MLPERAPAGEDLAARLRTVHMDMVAAVVAGEGLGRLSALAAEAVGAPVAVVVPRLGAHVGGRDVELAPVRACRRMVSTTVSTSWSATTHSILSFGRR